jgi:hypothetical protein
MPVVTPSVLAMVDSKTQLAAAAEALVQAAISTTNNNALALAEATVSEIKKLNSAAKVLVDTLTNDAADKKTQMAEISVKLDSLAQKLDALQLETKTTLKGQGRVQALQWAMTNRALAQFTYRDHQFDPYSRRYDYGQTIVSDTLMATILKNALQGYQTYLGNSYMVDYTRQGTADEDANGARKRFREALGKALHQLTAIEPTFTYCDKNEQWLIYLS